jgi:tetratricopeptide (TPR) repeat protein
MNPKTLCPLLLLLALSAPLVAQTGATAATAATAAITAGDAAWARRAEGHQGPRAQPGPIGEAVASYERAVKAEPDRLEGTWKLLRALHFQGDFVARTDDEKQKVFAHGKQVAEAGLDRLAKRAGGRAKLDAMTPAQAAKALAGIPEAPPLYLWSAVHWGLWGDVFGRLAAARQGVGDKVRRYSEVLNALDERYEDAAGHRILGRLHTLAPKVPFVTGWVDHDKAISELRKAVALGPDNLDNHLFLAEALFEHQPQKSAEAREILKKLLSRQPVSDLVVEQESTLAKARALLAKHAA